MTVVVLTLLYFCIHDLSKPLWKALSSCRQAYPDLLGGRCSKHHQLIKHSFVGVCNCYMFCCTFLYVHSSIAIILLGKKESLLFCLICLPGVS